MLRSYRTAFQHFVNRLQLPWRKTQRDNLVLWGAGFLAAGKLAVRRMVRALTRDPAAARHLDKRLRRFLGNDRLHLDAGLRSYLAFLLPRFGAPPFVPVMLDWTYAGAWAVLTLAVPYRGRSLPLFSTVHERAIERRTYSQTQAEISLLRRVGWCWPAGAPRPLLLADRGYDKSRLIEWLLHGTVGGKADQRQPSAVGSHPWLFIIRSCMRATVTDERGRKLQKRLLAYPGERLIHRRVTYHQEGAFQVHLVLACERDARRQPSTWHLITNLPEAHLEAVPRLYAARMQPEETFRDWKTGFLLAGFGLKGLKRMRRDRLERLLFCLTLAYGFLVLVAETERDVREGFVRRHFRLSLISFALDALRVVPEVIPRLARQACASLRLTPDWLGSGDS